MSPPARALRALPLLLICAACEGRQSALDPAGEDAAVLLTLFTVMLIGAVILWLAMNGMFYGFTRVHRSQISKTTANSIVIGGGILLPTLLIGALLGWGLSILPDHQKPGDGLRIRVIGEQWWWRVEYWPEGADTPVISANEIRLPAGQRTEFTLTSDRVIHSFWIPALGGKMDMFPGRETTLSLKPEKPGVYRGQCAELCGASHAWMAFEAVVMPPGEFDAWLEQEAAGAQPAEGTEEGRDIFFREGCAACHTIRGTQAQGQVGPDLTHVGSRHSLGAGRLGVTMEEFAAFVTHTEDLKPEVRMPAYDHLSEDERAALAAYLKGLE
ncbi:cytochrome c oxidase subunit II [Aquicoccus sp. SCR17]|nr:cytochrome c oxidase subunit II [Carideicomes alvinocaridis]